MDRYDRLYLINAYNATSTDDPPGSDQLETYEAWLERQLIARIERLKRLEEVVLTTPNDQVLGAKLRQAVNNHEIYKLLGV